METITTLPVTEADFRLDRYVSDHLPNLSRAAVQRLIDDGQIRVDGILRKASYHVQVGETIIVHLPPPEPALSVDEGARPEKIPLDILYEDDDLVVINKPAGMVVHPAAGHSTGTLVNAILAHVQTPLPTPPRLGEEESGGIGGVQRAGIVHRLDRDTSGIIVVAKNEVAMHDLQAQFKSRRVHKTYLALVEGTVKPPRGKIDAPIGRDPKHRQKMAVLSLPQSTALAGKRARGIGRVRASVTIYRTIANLQYPERQSKETGRYTLVEVEPQTGRTHQIRVHLTFLGFPVAGDAIYGRKKNALGLTRQFLHAWKLTFMLPRHGREVSFAAPLPEDLRDVLNRFDFDDRNLQ